MAPRIRSAAAVLLVLHGVIHLIGFVSPWRIATLEGFVYRTTIVGGADIGDLGARVIGLVWLGLTLGFIAAGVAVWRRKPWAVALTGVLAVVSFVVCAAGLPETAAGLAINVAILAGVVYVALQRPRAVGARRNT